MADLLYPTNGYRDELERKGQRPVDYMKAHKQQLRAVENILRERRDQLPPAPKDWKLKRFQEVPGRLSRPTTAPVRTQTPTRSASAKNFIAENALATITATPKRAAIKQESDFRETYQTYGKVPSYLEERKQELQSAKELKCVSGRKNKAEEAKWPKGHRLMGEEERLEELQTLRKSRGEIWMQLSRLPFTSDSLATKRKKGELELKLAEVESAISRFSQKKVFVQA